MERGWDSPPPGARSRRRVSCPSLVGRADEMALLERMLDDSFRADACSVVVAGEAGVGKSRLVAELAAHAAARRARVVSGHCLPVNDGLMPFAPLVEALRR